MGDNEHTVGDVVTTVVVREGVLEEIVKRHTDDWVFYEEGKPQDGGYHEEWTQLKIKFDDADKPEPLNWPAHVYFPHRVMTFPLGIRYTLESIDYVSQEKLDAYDSISLEFGTYDVRAPERIFDVDTVKTLYDAGGFDHIDMNRTVRRKLEFLSDGEVVLTYTHSALTWDKAVWEQCREKIHE